MKKQKIIVIVGGIVLIAVILSAIYFFSKKQKEQEVSKYEPVDVAVDFYKKWEGEVLAENTDPYKSGLQNTLILSPQLREKLKSTEGQPADAVDPVLCGKTADVKISTRRVFESENESQILVTSKDKEQTGQTMFKILKYKEGWYIDDITCSPGEFGEDKEFTFEREGFLVKGSNLESFDSALWYIVFEEDGQPGHYAPLVLGSKSVCVDKDGKENTCDTEKFSDLSKIFVRGQMTEGGVDVVKLEVQAI